MDPNGANQEKIRRIFARVDDEIKKASAALRAVSEAFRQMSDATLIFTETYIDFCEAQDERETDQE